MRGLLDTSIFIAREQERPLDAEQLPDETAVSVVTLAELELGVHMADSHETRARRLATVTAVRETYEAIPIDDGVASVFAALAAAVKGSGRSLKIQDMWIAATAVRHQAVLFTQDAGFDAVPGLDVRTI